MTSNPVTLLPCPFCGGEAFVAEGGTCFVGCSESSECCPVSPTVRSYGNASAITAWNTRTMQAAHTPPSDDSRQLREALEPFAREAKRWNMEPSALRYSFAGTGLSRGDIKRAADLYALLQPTGGENE